MAYVNMEVLLRELNHQLRSALSEAIHEHVDEQISVERVYQTFVAAAVRRCAKPQRISEEAISVLKDQASAKPTPL